MIGFWVGHNPKSYPCDWDKMKRGAVQASCFANKQKFYSFLLLRRTFFTVIRNASVLHTSFQKFLGGHLILFYIPISSNNALSCYHQSSQFVYLLRGSLISRNPLIKLIMNFNYRLFWIKLQNHLLRFKSEICLWVSRRSRLFP